jgi:AcrR family transcriptional regulator
MPTAGRPHEPRVDEAVRTAVVALLEEKGYAGMTIGDVAARAGVGRGALYRRWSSKALMAFASAVHPVELGDPPDTGSLRGDLRALAELIRARVITPSAAAALAGLVVELRDDPALAGTLDDRLWSGERGWMATILDRARERGETGEATDPELVRQLLIGTISFTVLYHPGAPVHAEAIADLVARGLGA